MLEKINKFLSIIERKKIGFLSVFLSIISIVLMRNIIEQLIKIKSIYVSNDYLTTIITLFFHFTFFWISVFFGLVLLLYIFVKQKIHITSVLNVSLFAFPIILFPPLFDFFIGDKELMMYPNNPQHLIYDTVNFLSFNKKLYGITIGMRIEMFSICLLFAFYIFLKTKKIFRTLLGFILSYLLIVFHGLWLSFFAQLYEFGFNFSDSFSLAKCKLFDTGYVLRGTQSKISIVFILLSFIYFCIYFYFRNKQKFQILLSQLRLSRLLHYVFLFLIGIFVGKRLVSIEFFHDNTFIHFFEFQNPFEIIGIFASAVSLILSFYSAVIFNDISDVEIDVISEPNRPLPSNQIRAGQYSIIGYFLLFFSLSIAYCINLAFFLVILLINGVAFLYNSSPFRLKKYLLISNFSLGFIALFTFFLGVSVYMEQYFFQYVPFSITLSLFISISIISQIKDIKDFTGDKLNNIKNFLTITNIEKGKYIIGFQILLVSVIIPMYFKFYDLLIFSILVTIPIVLILKRKKVSENILFGLYFVYLFWFFIRIILSDYLIKV